MNKPLNLEMDKSPKRENGQNTQTRKCTKPPMEWTKNPHEKK